MGYTFISGATGGIGKAFVFECAKLGYNLFLTGRSIERLSALKGEIEKDYGVFVRVFACDLTDSDQRLNLFNDAKNSGITFDRIINVAGVDTQKAFCEYTREKILFQLRVNIEATTDLTYLLLKIREPDCEVITISSMSGQTAMPYFALYSASKDYLTNLFTSLH